MSDRIIEGFDSPIRQYATDSMIKHFRFWCQKVLPLVYDDSLSYYEVLCKVRDYINQLIDIVTDHEERIEILEAAVESLQDAIDVINQELERIGGLLPSPEAGETGYVLTVINSTTADWRPVPNELPDYSSSDSGNVLMVDENGHLIWSNVVALLQEAVAELSSIVPELPEYSSSDNGKVLTVDSEGELYWAEGGGAGSVVDVSDEISVSSPATLSIVEKRAKKWGHVVSGSVTFSYAQVDLSTNPVATILLPKQAASSVNAVNVSQSIQESNGSGGTRIIRKNIITAYMNNYTNNSYVDINVKKISETVDKYNNQFGIDFCYLCN